MRKYYYLLHDLVCLCGALLASLYLRHGLPLIQEGRPEDIYLLLLATFVTGIVVLPLMRIQSSIWRFTSPSDIVDILIAVALVVLISNSSLFFISRLEMVPRSVPPMHWAITVITMSASRILTRKLFGTKQNTRDIKHHVIVIGACQTAELYLQFVQHILQNSVLIEGFVDSNPALTNRFFQRHRILGTIENLSTIIEQFHVHGIQITQLVLARPFETLSLAEQQQLAVLAEDGKLTVLHFAKQMAPLAIPDSDTETHPYIHTHVANAGIYPYVKRLCDCIAAMILATALSPLMLVIAMLVLIDVGFPVIFWQQRPGRYGKPFRMVKFRTMHRSQRKRDESRLNHKSNDETRTSAFGKILRRFRLDELPQLFHIIAGTMSFVGPRPLLTDDQPIDGEVRLSVRPGVTGWAQIHGGDALTPQEKLILDTWYITHQSLWLDIRILFRTLLIMRKADKPRLHTIESVNLG